MQPSAQQKAAFEKLKKQFLIKKNGKIIREVRYFQGGKAGWFLIEGKQSLYLGKNSELAYNKLLTLDPNKHIKTNDLLTHKAAIATFTLVSIKKRKKVDLKSKENKQQSDGYLEYTEPIEVTELDDFEIRCLLGRRI